MTMLDENSSFLWVLAAHVTLSIGLALLFTPLFTASLGSLKPELYSHGSAIVGTLQQLAGAAGTALFVTVMSAQAATLVASGASAESATAAGIRVAFTYGAIISLFAIPAAFFIRKQDAEPSAEPADRVDTAH
jgi:DHA2 family lincomycin resistance protein-like MFS transporter